MRLSLLLLLPSPTAQQCAAETAAADSTACRWLVTQVSHCLTRMLELVHRLLCPDFVLLTVIGPPDRSFVRDAAGIRPGAWFHHGAGGATLCCLVCV